MKTILGWGGVDPPVKNDFTSDQGAFTQKHKINKFGLTFVSEARDKFRDPSVEAHSESQTLTEYVQHSNQRLTK